MHLQAPVEAQVFVITFQQKEDNRAIIEAIEGELVFLIRSLIGDWPRYQNEIHFYSSREKAVNGARECTLEIWGKVYPN
ncbi:MAG: hypothetical protein R2799_16545 [Crocinitomicaceae bacterium]